MEWNEVLTEARACMVNCKACPECNGKACGKTMPGPGAKGTGTVAMRNYAKWQEVCINMDTLYETGDVDTSLNLFGRTFAYPFFAGPVGAVKMHYGEKYDDHTYDSHLVPGCAQAGIAAFIGDGVDATVLEAGVAAIAATGGVGVPTIKPWDMATVAAKFALAKQANPFCIAMDVDAAGLPFLKNQNPPAGAKSAAELAEIVGYADGTPFVVKGIMTPAAALRALEAGAAGIVVSNHGGRVQDGVPSTAEVLPAIAEAVAGRMTIFVDGGIRTGVDVFRALALGADACIIARPYVTAVYGGAEEGVAALTRKIGAELEDTMRMCGARSLADIDASKIWA